MHNLVSRGVLSNACLGGLRLEGTGVFLYIYSRKECVNAISQEAGRDQKFT